MRLSEFKKLMMTLMFVWLNINVLMLYNICSSSSQDNSDWLAVNVLMDSKEERNLNPSSRDAVVGTKDTRSSDQAVSTKPVEPANKNKNMKGGDEKVAVLVLVDSKEERIRNPRSRDDDVGTKVTRSSDQAASTKPVEPTNKNKNKTKKGGDEKVAVPVVKTSKTMVLALPEHCSAPKTGEIVLKGERHPGTNWITKIIWQNIQGENTIVKDSKSFGWKHGFLPPVGWGEPLSENEILVIVTRDVFTWLPKMMNETYDPIMNGKRGEGFSSFIRAEYANVCQPADPMFCKKYKKKASPYETADNLVQIRTQKYKQWLSDDPANATYSGSQDSFLKNRIHLRLESLSTDQRIDDNNDMGNDNFVLKIDCSNFRTPGLKQKKLVFKLFQFQNYFNFKINA
jgi:hypothetical protein